MGERCAFRLDSLSVYVVIASLQAACSISIVQGIDAITVVGGGAAAAAAAGDDEAARSGDRVRLLLDALVVLCGSAAALGGTYATVVFATCVLYGKVALEVHAGDDGKYLTFMGRTAPVRARAFRVLASSLLLFSLEVVFLVGSRVPAGYRLASVSAGCGAVWVGFRDFDRVVKAAAPIFVCEEEDKGAVKRISSR